MCGIRLRHLCCHLRARSKFFNLPLRSQEYESKNASEMKSKQCLKIYNFGWFAAKM